jgi:hypothetical protein
MTGPIIPVIPTNTEDVLYGSRSTSYRYELLAHDPNTGQDTLSGFLDGVQGGNLQWSYTAAVKGAGTFRVTDLSVAAPGMTRVSDVNLVTTRIRPVLVIDGLPEIPLGAFVVTEAPEQWDGEGRTVSVGVLDKCAVLDQDATDSFYVAPVGQPILQIVAGVVQGCGETIAVPATETTGLAASRVWDPGTSKLEIVNELLKTLGYNSLWADGQGNLKATANVLPANRPIRYDILDMDRELVDGPQSVYKPSWNRDKDYYGIPNRVVAVGQGSGSDDPPPAGVWTNEDPASPYSFQARGRWITHVLDGVDVPDGSVADQTAALTARARASLIAMSAPQAAVEVTHLPLPLAVGDVLRFASAPAGIDGRHIVTTLRLDLKSTGLMSSTLQEVVSL